MVPPSCDTYVLQRSEWQDIPKAATVALTFWWQPINLPGTRNQSGEPTIQPRASEVMGLGENLFPSLS